MAKRLKLARECHFRHATDAAAALGIGYPTYACHENASRAFDAESAVLYAKRYKVSLDWLLQNKGPGPGQIDRLQLALEAAESVDIGRQVVTRFLEWASKNPLDAQLLIARAVLDEADLAGFYRRLQLQHTPSDTDTADRTEDSQEEVKPRRE